MLVQLWDIFETQFEKHVNAIYLTISLLNNNCSKNKRRTHLSLNQTFLFISCKKLDGVNTTEKAKEKRIRAIYFSQQHSRKCVTIKFQFRCLYFHIFIVEN